MKIAFLNVYQDLAKRGAETYVTELSKRLTDKGNKVVVYGGKEQSRPRWPYLWRFYTDPHGLQIFWWTIKLIPALLKEKYDVVVPLNGGWQPALVRLATWLYGGKMIISGQSGIGWDDRNNLWCFPDIFVALSSLAEKWAKKANPFVKVEYIPNGVDLDMFSNSGEKMKINLKHPIVITVGAYVPEKRLHLVIKAVSKLNKVSLLIVGNDGQLKTNIRKLGYDLLGGRFNILSLAYNDMPKVYRAADVFTLASYSREAFGNAIVEAMAIGLPIVVNNDPIRSEIVGDAGILINPEHINDYSKALKLALSSKWDQKPVNQARKFDWDLIAEKYQKLFENLEK